MKLDTETFNSMKALSEIQLNLANGRAELKTLQEKTEEYIVFREEEANKRVSKVLKESHDALEHIAKNQNQLVAYGDDLKAFADTLKYSSDIVVTLFENFRKSMDQADIDMKDHYLAVQDVLKQAKIENSNIKSQRSSLKNEMKRIADETRLLDDRRSTLERGFEELRRLKKKNNG